MSREIDRQQLEIASLRSEIATFSCTTKMSISISRELLLMVKEADPISWVKRSNGRYYDYLQ